MLPEEPVQRLRRELSWLAKATGEARDLDVLLLQAMTAEDEAMLQTIESLRARQSTARAAVVHLLESERYRRLLEHWNSLLALPEAREAAPVDARRPIVEVARERVSKAARRARRKGRAVDSDSPAAELHRFRIACKKLRYLLEFFQSLYRPAVVRRRIETLEALQDCLGAINDLSVQRGIVDEYATTASMQRLARRLQRSERSQRRLLGELLDAGRAPR